MTTTLDRPDTSPAATEPRGWPCTETVSTRFGDFVFEGGYPVGDTVARLFELQDLWWVEAAKYNVLPLDWRGTQCMNAEAMGRPSVADGRGARAGTGRIGARGGDSAIEASCSRRTS